MKHHRWMTLLAAALIAGLALSAAPAALAQDGEPTLPPDGITDDDINRIAEQLYCPVCENIPLDVCGTQACADWRDEIRAMLEEGRSEDEIKAYFADTYGRRVLATPETRGIDVLVWVLPVVGVVTGVGVLVVALRRMAPGSLEAQADLHGAALSYEGLDPEYVARFEQELGEFVSQS
jgi:cytochrome c-type biogenesis protein CcmH